MKTVSVVIPIFNEAEAICGNLDAMLEHTGPLEQKYRFEFLLVNDGSQDETAEVLLAWCQQHPQFDLYSFTRNFGKEAAILLGLQRAQGEAVIVMDSDLQHPPALIPRMLELWEQGLDLVEAHKVSRGPESLKERVLANGFYTLMRWCSRLDLQNHSDFKLLGRPVVEAFLAMPEKNRFFRGLVNWMGYPSARIPFEVPERELGESKWSLMQQFRLSSTAIISFSTLPLQLVTWLGGATFLLSFLLGAKALYDKFSGQAIDGFTTVILLQLIIGSALMFSLGLLGSYLSRIYSEIKSRPSFLINERLSSYTGKK